MFYGLIIGVVIGAFVGWGIGIAIYDHTGEYDILKGWIGGVVVCAALIFLGGCVGRYVNITSAESYIAQYNITKLTYTTSLSNKSLSGLERIQLVKNVATENQNLADYQVNIDKIWNFDIPQDLKTEIKNLKYIKSE